MSAVRYTFFFVLTDLGWKISSGSSSDGVGRTLMGAFAELFLGVFVVDGTGICTSAVDFLFLGDDLAGSSYFIRISKTWEILYLWKIYLRFHISILVLFNFDDSSRTRTDATFLLQDVFRLGCDVIEKQIDELRLFGGRWEINVME